jgi:hypothetical protein
MKARSVKDVRKLVDLHQRGVACENELFTFLVEEAEKDFLAQYIAILPPKLAIKLPEWLDSQPKTDAEWASFYLPQLDGSEESFRLRIESYRAMVGAFRTLFSASPDPGGESGG